VTSIKNILVVSENRPFLNDLKKLLNQSQYQISGTNLTGLQLIEELQAKIPDLVILDAFDESDYEIKLLIEIRHVLDIPVILLDSKNIQSKIVEIIGFGDTSCLKQSIPLAKLTEQIEEILNNIKYSRC
jgi:DNA-binding NarL/FixJ family response regulator